MTTAKLPALQAAHQRFADEYLIDFNATAAYKRAGYKGKGDAAHNAASRILQRPEVQAYLTQRRTELAAKFEVTTEEVVRRLAFMALGDIRELFDGMGNLKPMSELTPEQASLIQGIETFEEYQGRGEDRQPVGMTRKVKLVSRLDAAKTLGMHLGMFTKKVEHSGPGGGPIQSETKVIGEILDLVDGADTGPGASASRR